jgi:hypothetical protein
MAYTIGSTIVATDYNGFVSTNGGANLNNVWSTGSGDSGYGEAAVSTVSAAATITATQWASLNSKISSVASHTGTAITSRANPTSGTTIAILAALNTDLTAINTNRNNAVASGSQYTTISGTNYKSGTTGSGTAAWTLTFTNTITWASADAARYFFNAGGRIKLQTNKSSTGTAADAEWNDLATTLMSDLFITGGTGTQNIAASNYTGTTRSGGTGSPAINASTTGWYDLTTGDTNLFQQYADTSPYTGMNILVKAKTAGTGTQLVITTVWNDPGDPGAYGEGIISGGTATSGATPGTAPCTIVTYYAPSSTYLTSAAWGTPSISATVA